MTDHRPTPDSSGSRPDISVVIPTYRGARSLPELTAELTETLDGLALTFELIIVNDSSPDHTWEVVAALAANDARIVGIDLLHNHGQPMATMCGLAASRGRLVATMDDDLEHRPSELPKLIEALRENPSWDAVVATWPVNRSLGRDIGSWIHGLADRVAWGTPRGFRHTAFRLMRRPACDALINHRTRTPIVGPMLHRVTAEVHNVDVEPGQRRHGSSGFTVRDGIRRVIQNFASGSTAPLKALSALGLVLAVAAFAAGGVFLLRWALGTQTPSGWLSVMLVTTFIGGTNLLAFGILGSYIDIIVREVRQPPRWSIRRETSTEQPTGACHDREDR